MDRLSPAFHAAFSSLMKEDKNMTNNEFMQNGMKILREHKLLKRVDPAHPKKFLTHIENRNRLMLNAKNVHKKGAVIKSIGADLTQMSSAVCVEIAPSGPTRASNLEANKALISKSKGLLAPMTGEEEYLSLGCGHTVAFCKVAPLGGKTFEKTLQDEHGRLDLSILEKQPQFKKMINEGWAWDVIPWDVDMEYPKFAKVVQRALNGSNSAASEIGELDTAVHLADLQEEFGDKNGWEKEALQEVNQSCQSCSAYSSTILDFVKTYGGGPGAPHITFMDNIGKSFNSTMVLGEEFWKAITYTKFYDTRC